MTGKEAGRRAGGPADATRQAGGQAGGLLRLTAYGSLLTAVLATGCAGAAPPPPVRPSARPPVDSVKPVAPAEQAFQLGWMPLASTNIPAFHRDLPKYDGSGVLIAILDSGIDPAVPGLQQKPDGSPKVLDLRDFSGEGRLALAPAVLEGDVVRSGAIQLRGAGRIRALHTSGPVWGGGLHELVLGEPPAADINGNGVVGDTLAVFVARASDGLVVFADTDGDGSLANERPLRDYLRGRDTFGWRAGGAAAPVTVAINLEDRGGETAPVLDLFFDTSGHGTHVAGIAAGNDLYGVFGFDGVAPGATLLGAKIANDARGGITVTGSMVRALDYAIRTARQQRLPLVVNLSFGVGNEAEGRARIDAVIDSVLAANPQVVMVLSAGNDGPGISTLGFPASARRGITVGATYPGAFLPPGPDGRRRPDLVAFFSARGGELAQPDLVAPGVAYSSVPRFDTGEEIKNGTSMAAPHVSGLAARLLSGLVGTPRTVDAARLRRILMAASTPLAGYSWIDQGAGVPDLAQAWRLLVRDHPIVPASVRAEHGLTAAVYPNGLRDSVGRFVVTAPGRNTFRLVSDVPWIASPGLIEVQDSSTVRLRYHTQQLREPGIYTGTVQGWGADSALGPAFRLVSTVVIPRPVPADRERVAARVATGQVKRIPILADSGLGLRLTIGDPRGAPLLAFLFEPGGMPWRGGGAAAAGAEDSAAVFELDARDVRGGVYELVVMAGPAVAVDATVEVDPAPVRLAVERRGQVVSVRSTALRQAPVTLSGEIVGAERGVVTSGRGSADQRVSFRLPAWARHAVIELELERDQWPWFTDFGLTLLDAGGRQIATSPMNYAIGRLETDLPEGSDRMAEIVLSPGFADPGANHLWSGRLAIRLYADEPVPLGDELGEQFTLPQLPFALGDGFFPLAHLLVRSGDRVWIRETGLPEAPGPLMR
jgi:tripeptidyl-peptidase-2